MLEWFAYELQSSYARGWILCRRLEWERGTVSSRVALLLRSAEVKPLFYRFVQLCWTLLSFSLHTFYFRAGSIELWLWCEYVREWGVGTPPGNWDQNRWLFMVSIALLTGNLCHNHIILLTSFRLLHYAGSVFYAALRRVYSPCTNSTKYPRP